VRLSQPNSRAFKRSWSFLVLMSAFLLMLTGHLTSEPVRAVVAVLSLAMTAQCWVAQRRYVKPRSRVVLLTLILLLPALGSMWLGLNVVRYYSYDPESPAILYLTVIRIQDVLVSCAFVVGLIAMQWLIAEIAVVIGRRVTLRFVGRRKTWWNRPLKGTWLLGSVVGYAISLLIVSRFLRWALLAVAILGIFFAAIFRTLRSEDEI
jgi:hypothetical protein